MLVQKKRLCVRFCSDPGTSTSAGDGGAGDDGGGDGDGDDGDGAGLPAAVSAASEADVEQMTAQCIADWHTPTAAAAAASTYEHIPRFYRKVQCETLQILLHFFSCFLFETRMLSQ